MSLSESMPVKAARSFDEHVHAHLAELERSITVFLRPIAEELGPLHEARRMHGGICPASLRYNLNGELDREHFKLQRREIGVRPGSQVAHAYLAPETLDGTGEDSRADCYALGAVLFQIIGGQAPASAARRVGKNDALRPADHSQWPATLLDAVNRCLVLDKTQRIATVSELWRALSAPAEQPVGFAPQHEPAAPPHALATVDSHKPPPTAEVSKRETETPVPDQTFTPATPLPISASAELPPASVAPASSLLESAPVAPAESSTPVPAATRPPATPAFPSKLEIRDRLANASVGKPYRQSVRDLFGTQIERVASVGVAVPEDSGLVFDSAEGVLYGMPTNPGELKLTLTYQLTDTPAGRPSLPHEVELTINPDPKSLWRKRESDQAGLFAKPDEAKDFLSTPHLTALAASLRGRSHAHEGKYRDDDFALRFVEPTGWHLFIVADGAGSAKYSRRGSQIACEVASTELTSRLSASNELDEALEKLGGSEAEDDREKLRTIASNLLIASAYKALAAIQKQASDQPAALRDFNTTFIVVLAKKLKARWFLASFAIGDGGAGALIDAERVELLTKPDSGEFAGQTIFLTSPQVFSDSELLLGRTQAAFCDDFRFLAVMTDGITDPIFESDTKFASATAWESWRQQLSQAVKLDALESGMERALLDYLHFPSPGNHDDRTLILAVPKPPSPRP